MHGVRMVRCVRGHSGRVSVGALDMPAEHL